MRENMLFGRKMYAQYANSLYYDFSRPRFPPSPTNLNKNATAEYMYGWETRGRVNFEIGAHLPFHTYCTEHTSLGGVQAKMPFSHINSGGEKKKGH